MDEPDLHEQISQIEDEIEEHAQTIEKCRSIVALSKAVVVIGGLTLLALGLGLVRSDPAVMIGAIAAVIGGTVVFGSHTSTSNQAEAAMKGAEAKRIALISQINFRVPRI